MRLIAGSSSLTTDCIYDTGGVLLDNQGVITLQHPEEHSFHCLVDVSVCRDSGYQVLGPKDPTTDRHCPGFRLAETTAVLDAARARGRRGYCSTCAGEAAEDAPATGYRATVRGTVASLGDGSDGLTSRGGVPLLERVEVLDEGAGCASAPTVPPLCAGSAAVAPPEAVGGGPAIQDPAPAPATEPPPPNLLPGAEPGLEAEDCTRALCENQLSPDLLLRYQINVPDGTSPDACNGCTLTVELIYEEEAWVALAFTTTGGMIGSEAVIGVPAGAGSVPLKYTLGGYTALAVQPMPESQQTLSTASVEVLDGRTVMRFTKIMKEPDEIEITMGENLFLWAHGSDSTLGYHGPTKASFELNLSSGTSQQLGAPNGAAWLAHGIVAFLAWGTFVPFAVQSSLLRGLLPEGPLWFKLHRAFNGLAYACFVAGFAVAVAYTSEEGRPHFANSHQRMGLAMFVLAFVQVCGGVLRPHVPDAGEDKSAIRKAWEAGHRVLGVALLACGFWQMGKGIELYAIKYSVSEDDERNLNIAYWVWIGVMSAIILLGGGYFKYKGKRSGNADGASQVDGVKPDSTTNGDGVELSKAQTAGDGV